MANMNFLIFSDIHRNFEGARMALERQITVPDAVLFLGDGANNIALLQDLFPTTCFIEVRGNCDVFGVSDIPDERVENMCGFRVLMLHGHTRGVKGGLGAAIKAAIDADADILLFGHTHTPLEMCYSSEELGAICKRERPLYIFNPGALQDGCFGTLTVRDKKLMFSHGNL